METTVLKEAAVLKKEIIKTIEEMEDIHLLEAVHTLLSRQIHSHHAIPGEEEISLMEEHEADYHISKTRPHTVEQVKKKILEKYHK